MTHLTFTESLLLQLLAKHGGLYATEMVNLSADLKRDTVYVLLRRMGEKGLVKTRNTKSPVPIHGRRPEIKFRISAAGQRALAEKKAYLAEVFELA